MARPKARHADIHAALRKLKNQSNATELELIEAVANMYEAFKDKKDQAVDKAKDTANIVNTSVHLYPWAYIGGAAAAGILAGLFLRRW